MPLDSSMTNMFEPKPREKNHDILKCSGVFYEHASYVKFINFSQRFLRIMCNLTQNPGNEFSGTR